MPPYSSNLIFWLNGRTLAGLADGTAVTNWLDSWQNHIDFTNALTISPTFTTNGPSTNTPWSAFFNVTNQTYLQQRTGTLAWWNTNLYSSYHVWIVAKESHSTFTTNISGPVEPGGLHNWTAINSSPSMSVSPNLYPSSGGDIITRFGTAANGSFYQWNSGAPLQSVATWRRTDSWTAPTNYGMYIGDRLQTTTTNNAVSFGDGMSANRSTLGWSEYRDLIPTSAHYYFNGWIAEVLMYGTAFDATGRSNINAWLDAKYGLTNAPLSGMLVNQNFEGTGYDNGETWTGSATGSSIVDPDYSAVVLNDFQSLRLKWATNGVETVTDITAQDEVYAYFRLRPITIDTSFNFVIFSFNQGATIRGHLSVNTDKTLRVSLNTVASTVGAVATNTTYHVWLHYKKGSGANAIMDVGFSTDGTRPTSGNNFAQITNGSNTQQISRIVCGRNAGVPIQEYIYDKVLVSSSVIGDNPP